MFFSSFDFFFINQKFQNKAETETTQGDEQKYEDYKKSYFLETGKSFEIADFLKAHRWKI